jgi:hypothetical protein
LGCSTLGMGLDRSGRWARPYSLGCCGESYAGPLGVEDFPTASDLFARKRLARWRGDFGEGIFVWLGTATEVSPSFHAFYRGCTGAVAGVGKSNGGGPDA